MPWPVKEIDSYKESLKIRPLSFPYNIQIGKVAKDFLKKALVVNEERRMTWEELLEHPLVKDKIAGEVEAEQKFSEIVQEILGRIQTDVQRKNVNQF